MTKDEKIVELTIKCVYLENELATAMKTIQVLINRTNLLARTCPDCGNELKPNQPYCLCYLDIYPGIKK